MSNEKIDQLPKTDEHKVRELKQEVEIMSEYISILSNNQNISNLFQAKINDQKRAKEIEQEKFILKELNNELEKKSELEIGKFLETISHELKTPLVPIKAYAEMLEEGKFGEVGKIQKQKLKAIDDNTRELIQIISNMIEYQKFSGGKIDLQKVQNDIKRLITDAHQFFASKLDEHGMKINSNFSKPLWILCDTSRTSQLLKNMLQIAFYSIPKKNGKIIFNVWEKENEVEIYIWYNAQDLSVNEFKKIFSDFYKTDTSSILSNGGIEIAMMVCKQIVEAHGGKLWFTLDNGGTKISFIIPK